MIDQIQDTDLAKEDVREFERLKEERSPWEGVYREVDERFPDGAGGFNHLTPGGVRGERNYDTTHIIGNERFAAAGVAITTPENQQYIHPRFSPELMKERRVQLWCQVAGQRLYDIRHAPHTGFAVSANEDWDQLGRYGTSPVWSEAIVGRGLAYRTLHLSRCWIDVDFVGLVNVNLRLECKRVAELADFFGPENLTPKMREAIENEKWETKFEVLHIVRPNRKWDPEAIDARRFAVASRYLALDEKLYLRRRGFHSMPVSVSRHTTSPEEKYGRSPAIKQMPTINGVNAMKHTTLRQGNKATDPAMAFYDDDGITRIATKPGGLNPGLVDESGRMLIHRIPGGEAALPWASAEVESERNVVRTAFLEDFYKILTDPASRMTTTQVLETMSKQGVLVRPFASRYAMEKQHPMTNRDLELALEAGQIPPFPPEVIEAGEWPVIDYENPLAAMARAEATSKTLRWVESLAPMAQADPSVLDWVDDQEVVPGMAAEIGVKPQYVRSPEQVAAIRKAREEAQAQAQGTQQLVEAAQAYKTMAQGNQISQAA